MAPYSAWRISLQAWFGLLALVLAIWLAIPYAGLIIEVSGILFGAFLLSQAIRPVADFMGRFRIPRGITVIIVYLGMAGLLALLGTLLTPMIGAEISRLQNTGPKLLKDALSRLATIPVVGQSLPSTDTLVPNLAQHLETLLKSVISAVAGIGDLALDVLVVLILTYFVTADAHLAERTLLNWVPSNYHNHIRAILVRLRRRLGRWVWAQLFIAIYFSLVFSIGLTLMGVPFALTIGLVGGVLEIVPYLGGVVAVFLAMFSALTVQPLLVVWVIIFYILVVEFESHFLGPALYGRITGLHPGAVLIALLVGVKAGGVIGLLFAVPVALFVLTLLEEYRDSWRESEVSQRS